MTDAPIIYEWTGEAMEPLPRFRKACDERYVIGERYRMDVIEARSEASHRQFFAAVHEAWLNLPERFAVNWPTSEHLRKHALCMTGFRDERSFVAASKAEAIRLAAFIRPIDDYAIVSVNECAVVVWTAKSQSYRAMGKTEFQRSKTAVLDYLDDLLQVQPGATAESSRSAA